MMHTLTGKLDHLHLGPYCGFPAVLNPLRILNMHTELYETSIYNHMTSLPKWGISGKDMGPCEHGVVGHHRYMKT